VQELLAKYSNVKMLGGQRAVVRNGYLPARQVLTAVGPVEVQVPKVRDRSGAGVKFNSALVPPFVRRSARMSAALPWLYLKGIASGDMREALTVLVGDQANGLSPNVVSRLKGKWAAEYGAWMKRDLSASRFVSWWADGIHTGLRQEDDARQCLLVIIGVRPDGRKELMTIGDGLRESKASWLDVLRDLAHHGLTSGPRLAVGNGALGFWAASTQVYPQTRCQRCWVHKTANVLNRLPKSAQPKAKADLHAIWMAPTRAEADKAFDQFIAIYRAKYPKAVEVLSKDRERLLTFYDLPAEHWRHLRTTNPIESSFATVRHRTDRTRGAISRESIVPFVFKLGKVAEQHWRKLNGFEFLAKVITGVRFRDGIEVRDDSPAQTDLVAA
jgi:transposase-like protein